jgi:hypothetical protein
MEGGGLTVFPVQSNTRLQTKVNAAVRGPVDQHRDEVVESIAAEPKLV